MRLGCAALLIVTWLRGVGVAGPHEGETPSHDPIAVVRASASSPWIDDAPAEVLTTKSIDEPKHDYRLVSAIGLAGVYATFSAWAYIAWYRNHPEKEMHDIGSDGWFGKGTYAGGADKMGHAWATMVLARGGTAALTAGGWDRTKSAIVSAVLSEGLFFAVEMKDYYYYEFSPGDMTFNTLGALTAVALDLSPRLDELFDFRVEYWPSDQYVANLSPDSVCAKRTPGLPSCSRWNIAEDYSGETYLLAFHLGGIHRLRDMEWGAASRFVDVVAGFGTRNYKPPPQMEDELHQTRSQTWFLGVSLNAQGAFDYFLEPKSKLRKAAHGLFEVLQFGGAVPLFGVRRETKTVASGGA